MGGNFVGQICCHGEREGDRGPDAAARNNISIAHYRIFHDLCFRQFFFETGKAGRFPAFKDPGFPEHGRCRTDRRAELPFREIVPDALEQLVCFRKRRGAGPAGKDDCVTVRIERSKQVFGFEDNIV